MKKLGLLAAAGLALVVLWSVDFTDSPTARVPPHPTGASGEGGAANGNDGASSAAAKYVAELALARRREDSGNALASYVSKPGIAGRNELDRIYVEGFPISEKSALAARALLRAGPSDDEKIALARILGRLYSPDNLTGYNADLLLDLRALINDNNKQVGRSAALTFSRLGYLPGSDAVLKTAFDNHVLGVDDYYGELAHMAPSAPAGVQDDLLAAVRNSANAYAADVLASSINADPAALKAYSGRSVDEIRQLLGNAEPRFALASGEFGLTDAVRYANWLRASAQIDSAASGQSIDALIVSKLSLPGTDPRKILAYLLTPEASSMLSSAQLGSPASGLVLIARQHAAQFPDNRGLQSAALEITSRVGRPRSNVP